MKRAFIGFCCVMLLAVPQSAFAQDDDPPCLNPDNTILVKADDYSQGWLTRENVQVVKDRLWKAAGGTKKRWDGGTLVVPCAIGGGPGNEMNAVTVTGIGDGRPASLADTAVFSGLARRTGHTQQEADVLRIKYSKLSGFRTIPDPDNEGQWVGEDELIRRHVARRLGRNPDDAPAAPAVGANFEQRAAELKKKIDAAKARAKKTGDMSELMQLATEGQKLSSPIVEQSKKIMKASDAQAWEELEQAYPELAEASWPTVVVMGPGACIRCAWFTGR
jgi:hypothetical protein